MSITFERLMGVGALISYLLYTLAFFLLHSWIGHWSAGLSVGLIAFAVVAAGIFIGGIVGGGNTEEGAEYLLFGILSIFMAPLVSTGLSGCLVSQVYDYPPPIVSGKEDGSLIYFFGSLSLGGAVFTVALLWWADTPGYAFMLGLLVATVQSGLLMLDNSNRRATWLMTQYQ